MPARIVPSQNNANLEALEQQKENQEGLREARTQCCAYREENLNKNGAIELNIFYINSLPRKLYS